MNGDEVEEGEEKGSDEEEEDDEDEEDEGEMVDEYDVEDMDFKEEDEEDEEVGANVATLKKLHKEQAHIEEMKGKMAAIGSLILSDADTHVRSPSFFFPPSPPPPTN